ncbi:unnamed protein product [Closterium sp. NIES-53]
MVFRVGPSVGPLRQGPPTVCTAPGAAAVVRCPSQRYRAALPRDAPPRAALLPHMLRCPAAARAALLPVLPRSPRAALLTARDLRQARVQLARRPRALCPHAHCLRAPCLHARPALLPAPHCPAVRALPFPAARALPCLAAPLQPARRPALQPARCPALQPVRCPATTATTATATAATTAVASATLAPLLLTANACHGHYYAWDFTHAGGTRQQQQSRRQETLSPQQLREWGIQRERPGGGGYGAGGIGQQQQQCQQETLSPQQLHEWVSRRCIPSSVEATNLGACEPGSTGAVSVEALHTFTLDSGATRCFFRDCTPVTPLTTPVLVSLADPSRGPVVACASTVLPCPASPSGSLTGFHLPSFSKNLVRDAVLQDQFGTVTTPGGELVAICMESHTGKHLATFTLRPGSGMYTRTTESAQVAASGQSVCFYRLHPHVSSPLSPPPLFLVPSPSSVDPPPPQGLAPSGVSQVDPSPLVETLEVSSDTSGRAEGGGPAADDTAANRRSPRLETPPGFPPRPSSPPQMPVAVDSGAARDGDPEGADSRGAGPRVAESGVAGSRGADSGGAGFHLPSFSKNLVRNAVLQDGSVTVTTPGGELVAICTDSRTGEHLATFTLKPGPGLYTLTTESAQVAGSGQSVCFYRLHPHVSSPLSPLPLFLVPGPPSVDPLPPQGPAPSGVSQVDPPPLVETLEVSSDTSGRAEGGGPAADDTAANRRSPRLETPPGFPPQPSSPPQQPVAVDSGATGGGDPVGAESTTTRSCHRPTIMGPPVALLVMQHPCPSRAPSVWQFLPVARPGRASVSARRTPRACVGSLAVARPGHASVFLLVARPGRVVVSARRTPRACVGFLPVARPQHATVFCPSHAGPAASFLLPLLLRVQQFGPGGGGEGEGVGGSQEWRLGVVAPPAPRSSASSPSQQQQQLPPRLLLSHGCTCCCGRRVRGGGCASAAAAATTPPPSHGCACCCGGSGGEGVRGWRLFFMRPAVAHAAQHRPPAPPSPPSPC